MDGTGRLDRRVDGWAGQMDGLDGMSMRDVCSTLFAYGDSSGTFFTKGGDRHGKLRSVCHLLWTFMSVHTFENVRNHNLLHYQ